MGCIQERSVDVRMTRCAGSIPNIPALIPGYTALRFVIILGMEAPETRSSERCYQYDLGPLRHTCPRPVLPAVSVPVGLSRGSKNSNKNHEVVATLRQYASTRNDNARNQLECGPG